jgi:macrolide-specific efflux system membrane fusion protein
VIRHAGAALLQVDEGRRTPLMSVVPSPRSTRSHAPLWPAILLGLFVFSLLASAGWYAWQRNAAAANTWLTAAATRGDIEDSITATGTLQPKEFVDVGTQVSGQVRSLNVELGAVVNKGDLLAEIDPTVYQTRVDATQAQLRNQRAQLADREAQRRLAQLQMNRERALAREDATSADAVQSAEAGLQSATAQVESLKAQIQQTESTLRGDQASIGYTKIRAPIAGTVVSIAAKQGQTLNANQSAPIVLRIADLSSMTVQSQVSEADVGKLKLGMPVYFTTLAGDQRRFYGTLRQVSPTPTVLNNVVLYDALFDVPNPDQVLMTQMTAQVFFLAASARNAVLVPVTALRALPRTGTRGSRGADGAASAAASEPESASAPVAAPAAASDARSAASGPGSRRGARAGSDPRNDFANRRARLSVLDAAGQPVEREVQVGVVNRVSAQILSGVEPGEQVVIGRSTAGTAAATPARPTSAGLTPTPSGTREGPR